MPIAPQLYWVAHQAHPAGFSTGPLYAVDRNLVYQELTDAPDGYWVTNHGLMTITTDGNTISWSEEGDSTSWPALNNSPAPRECGKILALVSFADGQTLILGERGIGILSGDTADSISMSPLNSFPVADPAHSAVKAGSSVLWIAPGPRVVGFDGQMNRLDFPVHKDLRTINNLQNVRCWWDATYNTYNVSVPTSNIIYVLDLDRGRWMGTWSIAAAQGVAYERKTAAPFQRTLIVSDEKLGALDPSTYTDLGSAFTCKVETEPNHLGVPEKYKSLSQVYIYGSGTWYVKVRYRDTPDGGGVSGGGWTDTDEVEVTAPGWAYFDPIIFTERIISARATAASSIRLTPPFFNTDERIIGLRF